MNVSGFDVSKDEQKNYTSAAWAVLVFSVGIKVVPVDLCVNGQMWRYYTDPTQYYCYDGHQRVPLSVNSTGLFRRIES